jgi:hypothetical protein
VTSKGRDALQRTVDVTQVAKRYTQIMHILGYPLLVMFSILP